MTNNKEKLFPGDNCGTVWAPIVFIHKLQTFWTHSLKYDHYVDRWISSLTVTKTGRCPPTAAECYRKLLPLTTICK